MANTVIQLKRSSATATPTNGTLSAAEPAYSFNSDKLFLGNTAGTGVIEIGGKYWVDTTKIAFDQANAAFAAANSGSSAGAAFGQANTARDHANASFGKANTADTNAINAFGQANTATTNAGNAFGQANTARDHANAAFGAANTAGTNAINAFGKANTSGTDAINAFAKANAALPNTSGVSFAGALTIPDTFFVTINNTAGLAVTGEIAEFAHNANSYTQIHVRNANTGTQSSGDIVVTADSGSDTLDFVDLGINGSGFNQASWTINGAKDAYLYASNGNFAIGVSNVARSLTFFTGGTLAANERLRIDPAGNVLIGRTTSTVGQGVDLDINGAVNASAYLVNGTAISSGITLANQSTATQLQYPLFTTSTSGSASTANVASTKLTYNVATGTLSTTNFNSTSDRNKKENIVKIDDALLILNTINGVRFNWKDNKLPSVGVIAQDVEKMLPELVGDEKSVNYNGLIAVLIEAVKELKAEIELLKSR